MSQIFQQFQLAGIRIQEQWLASQMQANAPIDYQGLYNIFLNSDLKESCIPLDSSLITQLDPASSGKIHHENVFPQGVVLQLIDISDISKSLSNQSDIANGIILEEEAEKALEEVALEPVKGQVKPKWKKPQAQGNSNAPTSGSRTLRFVLSDGLNELVGFEYKAIPNMTCEAPLGCKVFIKSVEVLREHLLLTGENMKMLGGFILEMNELTYAERLEAKCKPLKASSTIQNMERAPFKRGAEPLMPSTTKRSAIVHSSNVYSHSLARNNDTRPKQGAFIQKVPFSDLVPSRNLIPANLNLDFEDNSDIFDDSMLNELLDTIPSTKPSSRPIQSTPLNAPAPVPKVPHQNKPNTLILDDSSDWDEDDFM